MKKLEEVNDMLIIPDVHGRNFWESAVEKYSQEDTIFLGDYHDPYPDELISEEESLENFIKIIAYARNHENCHLLLGNHDLHYLCNFGEGCRLDYQNSAKIHGLLYDNIDLFSIVGHRVINGKDVIFSHAPIFKEWLDIIGETDHLPTLVRNLNSLLQSIFINPWETERILGFISYYRGGNDITGSCVWADVNEILNNHLIPTVDYSIFAHTQLREALISDSWANLDCKRAFILSSDLHLSPII